MARLPSGLFRVRVFLNNVSEYFIYFTLALKLGSQLAEGGVRGQVLSARSHRVEVVELEQVAEERRSDLV